MSSEVFFAPMYRRHVPLIGTMERRNYEFSWTDGIFRDCLKAGYTCQLMMLDDELIGYGIMQLAAGEAHILNLCIDKPYQRQGFARVMLDHLVQIATDKPSQIIFLEVRPSNPRALNLYQQSGFNEVGLRKGYYDAANGREDAIVMARNILQQGEGMLRH